MSQLEEKKPTDEPVANHKSEEKEESLQMGNLVDRLRGKPEEGAAVSVGMEAADYDTDEEKAKEENKPKQKKFKHRPRMYRQWSDKDTKEYRKRYPGKKDYPALKKNYLFYTNEIESTPYGGYIDDIHKTWYGDHEKLESHHGYIQWIFPIRETGMNCSAQELQMHEAKAIKQNPEALNRVLLSYMMMLDFYGMKLKNKETGLVGRSEKWKERFLHLNRSMHNYLRITRILKSLGELGYEHYKVPFIEFCIREIFERNTLENCASSCMDYWVNTIRDNDERSRLLLKCHKYFDY